MYRRLCPCLELPGIEPGIHGLCCNTRGIGLEFVSTECAGLEADKMWMLAAGEDVGVDLTLEELANEYSSSVFMTEFDAVADQHPPETRRESRRIIAHQIRVRHHDELWR